MRVLLDTCVMSELRHPKGNPAVRQAVAQMDPESVFISVITIGEIVKGITLLPQGPRKRGLEAWLEALERDYADRLLPIDRETSRIWGELTAGAQKAGRTVHATDGLIAATALRHGLHVMTRNTADFAPTSARLVNPWAI